MKYVSSEVASGHSLTSQNPTRHNAEKLEKRRMALLILTIALAVHLGAKAIGNSGTLVISYLTPELFDFVRSGPDIRHGKP
ncbi:hypothetical protein [Roseobacter ponti]|uniref:Uncharacterized protein n=1 Tax=Roseobacter ponti TaxID=1891787 RepID=A0A858SV22_9RHOB|nr:hypothetical protein [Roseobacter ponti]QJF51838.1 hypothetical protein G3256_12025 [Roseobacter ponti]